MYKQCLHCGKEIKVKPSHYERTKYCSRKCLKADKNIILICPGCGKQMICKACHKGINRYCSKECRHSHLSKVEKECIWCKKKFYIYPDKTRNALYCSKNCQYDSGRDKYKMKVCEQCGIEYKSYNRDAIKSKYCSKRCYHLAHTTIMYCEFCGAEYETKKSHASHAHFCGKECANEAYRIRYADMTYDHKDKNHDEIVSALLDAGAKVLSLSSIKYGCPDILIGWHGKILLAEIKSKKGKLSPAQVKFFDEFRGFVTILRSTDDAMQLLNDWTIRHET